MTDIDDMTEKQIDEELRRLHDVQQNGELTPAQARRMFHLRAGRNTIQMQKRSAYWL